MLSLCDHFQLELDMVDLYLSKELEVSIDDRLSRRTMLPLWWSQIRPVQDSTESGTATVAVPDSYRARFLLCY